LIWITACGGKIQIEDPDHRGPRRWAVAYGWSGQSADGWVRVV